LVSGILGIIISLRLDNTHCEFSKVTTGQYLTLQGFVKVLNMLQEETLYWIRDEFAAIDLSRGRQSKVPKY
jgi:hypothetical protein